MRELIPIEYRPIKKIVVLEALELDSQELFRRASATLLSGQPVALNWVNGVVFLAIPANTDINEVNENVMKGIIYLVSVLYSSMPKFKQSIKVGAVEVPVIDQTKSLPFMSLAVWLHERMNKPK